jgi:PAS domain S-box-containing protein/diguanylate cyclase (GGDEF)-like protein
MFDFKKLFQINIKKNKDGKFYPLTSFLIKKLLIGNFFIFSFVTAIQMIFDYSYEYNRIHSLMEKTANRLVEANVLYINPKEISFILKDNPEINEIIVIDKYGKKYNLKSDKLYSLNKYINVSKKTNNYSIQFIANKEEILREIEKKIKSIAITNLLIVTFSTMVIYFFSKKFLVKPLVNFSKELTHLSSEDNMPMVTLGDMEVDEIHRLKDTANIFIQEIFVLKESYKLLIDDIMEKYEVTLKENHQLEEVIKDKEFKFQSIFEESNVPMAISDIDGYIVECNDSYIKFLGFSNKKEILGLNFTDFTHPKDINQQREIIRNLALGKDINKRVEKRYISKSNEVLWADITFNEIKNNKGTLVNFVIMLVDITEKKKYEDELKKLYNLALDSNALTNLPGNNSIRKKIEEILLLDTSKKYSVVYSDLDNFKAYNDNYGFAMGDKVLLHTAETFRKSAKSLNIEDYFLGHIGGDDFVIVIPTDFLKIYLNLVISDFDESIKGFYSKEDVKNGYIKAQDREGIMKNYPIISISMAGVILSQNNYKSFLEINDSLSDAKKVAKNHLGSYFHLK